MVHLTKRQKLLLSTFKAVLAAVILAFLFTRIQRQSGFTRLLNEPKHWASLLVAQGLVLTAFSLSFVRWFLLVRGLNMEFHLRDAFRLGSLGFMLNQVSPGSVGGDLLKAVFIAKEQPGRRPEAVATVLIDRFIGLYAMLLVASVGLTFAEVANESIALIHTMQTIVWTSAAVGTAVFALVMSPMAPGRHFREPMGRLPVIGHTLTRLIDGMAVYRSRRRYLFAAIGLATCTHILLVVAFWCVSRGLPVHGPTFFQNASIVPIALVAGAIPMTPSGLGTLEFVLEFLYVSIGASKGDGTIVSLAYRATTYVVAGVGACYYLSSRKNVDRMLHDAEALAVELE